MNKINETGFSESNLTEPSVSEEYGLPEAVLCILIVLYSASSGISIVGNVMIVTLNVTRKASKSPVKHYITALALSGILLHIFCVPFTALTNLVNYNWIFGRFMCSMLGYIQTAVVVQYSFTLVASSMDRYLALSRPLHKQATHGQVLRIVLTVWIISFIIPIPVAYFSQLVPDTAGELCVEAWPDETYRQIYSTFLMTLTYAVPLVELVVTYGHITVILSRKPPGVEHELMIVRRTSAKKKNIKCFVFSFGAYAICWLPIHVITIIGDVNPSIYGAQIVHILWLFAHWMAMSNSAVTAIISLVFNTSMISWIWTAFRNRAGSDVSVQSMKRWIRRRARSTLTDLE